MSRVPWCHGHATGRELRPERPCSGVTAAAGALRAPPHLGGTRRHACAAVTIDLWQVAGRLFCLSRVAWCHRHATGRDLRPERPCSGVTAAAGASRGTLPWRDSTTRARGRNYRSLTGSWSFFLLAPGGMVPSFVPCTSPIFLLRPSSMSYGCTARTMPWRQVGGR